MRVVAAALSVWMAVRWLGLLVGIFRIRKLDRIVRRQARRAGVVRGALTVFGSVAAVYAWAYALRLQPAGTFVGWLAGVLMASLCVAVLAAFMQPPERDPASLDQFRVRRPPRDEGPRR